MVKEMYLICLNIKFSKIIKSVMDLIISGKRVLYVVSARFEVEKITKLCLGNFFRVPILYRRYFYSLFV